MHTAGLASCGTVNGRVARCAGSTVARRDGSDLSFAKHPVAPGSDKLACGIKIKNGMCSTMQHKDVAPRVDSNTGNLNEIPWGRCSGGGARWNRPVRH